MEHILTKAQRLIEQAKNDEDFFADHAHLQVASGERQIDYSALCLDLDDDHYMIMDFVEFDFQKFTIVHRDHQGIVTSIQAFEQMD